MPNNRIEHDFGLAAPLRSAANPKRFIHDVGSRKAQETKGERKMEQQYESIFQGMMDDSSLSSATSQFAQEVNSNPIAILTAFMDWDQANFSFSHNNFIFAIYDRWTPISAQCIWKAHMCSKWSFTSGSSDSILARVLREAINRGDDNIVEDIKEATPDGQESHLREVQNMVST